MLGAKDAAAETQAAMATIRIMMAEQAPVSALRRAAAHLFPAGCAAKKLVLSLVPLLRLLLTK